MTNPSHPGRTAGSAEMPVDAKVVLGILNSMGVEEHEPRVIHQFLEFIYRYITEVLSDAKVYSEHASKPALDIDDVRLAIQSRVNFSFTQPPPREILLELARMRNSIPLPPLKDAPGIALPAEEDTLITPNYQVKVPLRVMAAQPREAEREVALSKMTKRAKEQKESGGADAEKRSLGTRGEKMAPFAIVPPAKRPKVAPMV